MDHHGLCGGHWIDGYDSDRRMVIPCRDDLLDPARFLSLLGKERITFFGATPLFLSQLQFDRESLPHLRQLFSGGEAIAQANLAGLPKDIPLVNGWGSS